MQAEDIEKVREISEALDSIARNLKKDRKTRLQILEQVVALNSLLEDWTSRLEDAEHEVDLD